MTQALIRPRLFNIDEPLGVPVEKLSGAELVRAHGAETTVGQIARRLRCSCGRRWPSVTAVILDWREGMRLPNTPQWPPKRRREPEWPHG